VSISAPAHGFPGRDPARGAARAGVSRLRRHDIASGPAPVGGTCSGNGVSPAPAAARSRTTGRSQLSSAAAAEHRRPALVLLRDRVMINSQAVRFNTADVFSRPPGFRAEYFLAANPSDTTIPLKARHRWACAAVDRSAVEATLGILCSSSDRLSTSRRQPMALAALFVGTSRLLLATPRLTLDQMDVATHAVHSCRTKLNSPRRSSLDRHISGISCSSCL